MKIYVGRWSLLPREWDGINGLQDKTEEEVLEELKREISFYDSRHLRTDKRMGIYTPQEFEAEFNFDTTGQFSTDKYWIRIF